MRADFQIIANGEDATATLRERLLSLSLTDEVGTRADTLTLQLDDRDNPIAWPDKGAEIEVHLGDKSQGLMWMGLYTVDEVEYTCPPATLIIRAKAANMRVSLKAPKSRSWDSMTLGELVATIAEQHQLTPSVADDIAAINIAHLDQTHESDLHLLMRLAHTYGAFAKPMGNYLVFVPRGQAKTASKQLLPVVTITHSDIIHCRLLQTDRSRYQAVRAQWHNVHHAQLQSVTVGNGQPLYTLRHTYADQSEASHAAQAKLSALQHGTATLSLTVIGTPKLQAAGKIKLTGLRAPLAGEWVIEQVRHELNAQGLITHTQAKPPK